MLRFRVAAQKLWGRRGSIITRLIYVDRFKVQVFKFKSSSSITFDIPVAGMLVMIGTASSGALYQSSRLTDSKDYMEGLVEYRPLEAIAFSWGYYRRKKSMYSCYRLGV